VEDPACACSFVVLDNAAKTPEHHSIVVLLMYSCIFVLVLNYTISEHSYIRSRPQSSSQRTYLAGSKRYELLNALFAVEILGPSRMVDRICNICERRVRHAGEVAFVVVRKGIAEGIVCVSSQPDRSAYVSSVLEATG